MVNNMLKFFCSLRLTVVLLTLAMLLVFFGTMAQVDLGLYQAQAKYFHSLVVFWSPKGMDWQIPVFPGGYLIGGFLLINLMAAHVKRFKFSWKHFGLFIIHAGIVLLLVGQLCTDLFSVESGMSIREGESKNYSEASKEDELAIIDSSQPDFDQVLSVPCHILAKGGEFVDSRIPFTVHVQRYFPNSEVGELKNKGEAAAATLGSGTHLKVESAPAVTKMDERNVPSAVIELQEAGKTLGSFLVSEWRPESQEFQLGGKTFKLAMRPVRFYKPFSLQLIKFSHDRYMGSDIPMNFSSDVQLINPETKENRRVRIYMNNPLRYGGETFYQSSFDERDPKHKVTILQVVRNPGWLTPYFACLMVAAGMLWQFLSHLTKFVRRPSTSQAPAMASVRVNAKAKRTA
jgi:hypothetical protein